MERNIEPLLAKKAIGLLLKMTSKLAKGKKVKIILAAPFPHEPHKMLEIGDEPGNPLLKPRALVHKRGELPVLKIKVKGRLAEPRELKQRPYLTRELFLFRRFHG